MGVTTATKKRGSKYERCVMAVKSKQTKTCLKRKAWGKKVNGKRCYNPWAVCARLRTASDKRGTRGSGKKEIKAGKYQKRDGSVVQLYKLGRSGTPYYRKKGRDGKMRKVYLRKK